MNSGKKSVKSGVSTLMFIAAGVVFAIGAAAIVMNVISLRESISQYVAQGYPSEMVTSALIKQQLGPDMLEPFATYLGLALALLGIGLIYKKVTAYALVIEDVFEDECECEECTGTEGVDGEECCCDGEHADGEECCCGEHAEGEENAEGTESAEPAENSESAETEAPVCKKCGAALDPDSTFCTSCGEKL